MYRRVLTEMLLAEHLDANPGGRPNELTDLAAELGASAPFLLPDAKREQYDDRNKLDARSVWSTAEREKVGMMTMVGDAYAGPLV